MAITHGGCVGGQSYLYRAYWHAKKRCEDPKNVGYKYYGGRGIKFRFKSFVEWKAALGRRPKDHEVDRKDVNGHYERGNMQWATESRQVQARRPWNKYSKYKGVRPTENYKRWQAYIHKGKFFHIGIFDTVEEAARAYDVRALKLFGPKAMLNFP